MTSCRICGASAWDPLPHPHDARAVLSDLRVIDEPLDKWICRGCALVRRRGAPAAAQLFASGYVLYDHPPGERFESERQRAYASWIAAEYAGEPASVLDVGCGNGSLLVTLRERWPRAALRGIDPSPESTRHAVAAGFEVATGTLDSVEMPPASLVVCINVVEHAEDPGELVRRLAASVDPRGTLLIVCPDGREPWAELVFADHASSFVPAHLAALLGRAGFEATRVSTAPAALGRFMMIAARSGRAQPEAAVAGSDRLARAKREYLERWRALDETLLQRMRAPKLVCFGTGEAAGLLRAYAPGAWSRVTACAVDGPAPSAFGDRPVLTPEHIPADADLLLGVRPEIQARLAERFSGRHWVIRWDDLIPQ